MLKFNRFGPGYKPLKPHDNKLGPLGTPLRITEKLSRISYRLALPSDSRIHDVVSIIHLRRYNGVGQDVRPLPIQVDGAEEYEAECIDGQRINSQGTVEFLVKWFGYADKERTWEPISNLSHADAAIAKWNASRKDDAKPKKTRHPRQPAPDTIGRRTRSQSRSPSPHAPSPHTPSPRADERSSNQMHTTKANTSLSATATAPQPRRSARIQAQSNKPSSSNSDAKSFSSRPARDRQHLIASSTTTTQLATAAAAKQKAAAAEAQKTATAQGTTAGQDAEQEDAATQEATNPPHES